MLIMVGLVWVETWAWFFISLSLILLFSDFILLLLALFYFIYFNFSYLFRNEALIVQGNVLYDWKEVKEGGMDAKKWMFWLPTQSLNQKSLISKLY